jgi:2-polyprenyl-3-methyl-5-hydroxy-6-metoxy-1,4-benzoquinol methylase
MSLGAVSGPVQGGAKAAGRFDCELTGSPLQSDLAPWHFSNETVGIEYSTLRPAITPDRFDAVIDETRRRKFLERHRQRTFALTLEAIAARIDLIGATVLDIGCAHGWFLDMAREQGARTFGVEPEGPLAGEAASKGHVVYEGLFPQAVPQGMEFDVVAFNDVLEHIPGQRQVLASVRESLKPGGLLSIAIPLRSGAIYRTAKILARLGLQGPFGRMWQHGFQSPHVVYHSAASLERLAADAGFRLVARRRLPSITIAGLWQRIRYDRSAGVAGSMAVYAAALGAAALLPLLPADTELLLFAAAE